MASFFSSITTPLRLVILIWLIFLFEFSYGIDLGFLGVLPRNASGAWGVLFAPLLHGNFYHLLSNTVPLIFLSGMLYLFYNRIASRVFTLCYFFPSILVWFFGREFYHIGASGLIYALAAFLIAFGIFRRELKALLISALIVILYGGLLYGIVPNQPGVSWESHLFGAIVGVFLGIRFSKVKTISG